MNFASLKQVYGVSTFGKGNQGLFPPFAATKAAAGAGGGRESFTMQASMSGPSAPMPTLAAPDADPMHTDSLTAVANPMTTASLQPLPEPPKPKAAPSLLQRPAQMPRETFVPTAAPVEPPRSRESGCAQCRKADREFRKMLFFLAVGVLILWLMDILVRLGEVLALSRFS
jgi:hypothetical protein